MKRRERVKQHSAPLPLEFKDCSDQTFHEKLVRERPQNYRLEEVYEILDEIGRGGLCQIYKIHKRADRVGGSSRQHCRRRTWSGQLLFPSMRRRRKMIEASATREALVDTTTQSTSPPQQHLYFALKVINLKMVRGGSECIDQLQNEVEILKALDHPCIIKAYETFFMRDTKQLAIVMELCTGGDLYARMPYTERQVSHAIRQVLKAITYLHGRKIIHRDIKMENIMFESTHLEAAIKVLDFGLSKRYSNCDSLLKERVGTLYSMSPETMKGDYNYQADLWSVGVVAFIMLSGEKPFEAKTPKELVAKILLGQYSFDSAVWDHVSDRAKDFIRKLLVVKAEHRLTGPQALRHEWVTNDFTTRDTTDHIASEEMKERVRKGIVRYAKFGEFRKLALNIIAKNSSAHEIFELRKVFDEFDTLQTGTITMEEFRDALAKFDYSERDLQNLFRKVDVNQNNVINYTEFLAAALETQGSIAEYRLAEAFDVMDTDDSGYISRENLREILGKLADDKYIDTLLSEADSKKDGRISYEEFLQMFSEQKHNIIYEMYEGATNCTTQSPAKADEVLMNHGITLNNILPAKLKIS